MRKKAVSGLMLTLLLITMFSLTFDIQVAKAELGTIIVPDDHVTIQGAINAAGVGDTIFVRNGIYYEDLYVNKPLTIMGESRSSTIIDGGGTGSVIDVMANDVSLSGFTVQNGGWGWYYVHGSCIHVYYASSCSIKDTIVSNSRFGIAIVSISIPMTFDNTISGNIISDTHQGIVLHRSDRTTVAENDVSSNEMGIRLWHSSNNSIFGNNIANNDHGICLFESSNNNSICHNNFNNNTQQAYSYISTNVWDVGYPSGGNYWSDYTDVDLFTGPNQDLLGMDGIWDYPYIIDSENQDRYPLVKPWPIIPARVDVNPDALNLRSKGQWINAYIQLPDRYNAENIDPTTILLNETIQPVLDPKYDFVTDSSIYIVDHDGDGVLERVVKLNRTEVAGWIVNYLGIQYGNVALTITGEVDGTPFEGTDTIRVLFPGDVDDDGDVDYYDFIIFSGCYCKSVGNPCYDPRADFDEDGCVGYYDFLIFAENHCKTAI